MVRRCSILFVEIRAEQEVQLCNILYGGNGVQTRMSWRAYAPHLEQAVEIQTDELLALQQISPIEYHPRDELEAKHGSIISRLLVSGLLIERGDQNALKLRDQSVRDVAWWPLAALAVSHGRWRNVRLDELKASGRSGRFSDLIPTFGPAPTHEYRRVSDSALVQLSHPMRSEFDELLSKRKTCRNFDPLASVSMELLSTMLSRVWRVAGTHRTSTGLTLVRKASPAGGGLHATEAYLLIQRAEGLGSGIYHYLPVKHALEQIAALTCEEAQTMATRFVAGQGWFANAPILVVMTTRYDRLFWKYREHSKAWRVASLDAGHLSQTMYLSAADLGLGAFVSAAVDDKTIEEALKLDPLSEGVTVVGGFGQRLSEPNDYEPEFA